MGFAVPPTVNLLLLSSDPKFIPTVKLILSGGDTIANKRYKLVGQSLDDAELLQGDFSHYDAILLDYRDDNPQCLHFFDSYVTCSYVRPLILVADSADRELEKNAMRCGTADLIVREQLNRRDLMRSIRYVVDRGDATKSLEKMVHYDPLTGVPNRLLFRDRLSGAIGRANRDRGGFALLFIGLDGFKKVNDAHGHNIGDALLFIIAGRLKQCIRNADSLARIGGDEFSVILENTHQVADISAISKKLIESVAEPCVIQGHSISVNCSIGIAIYEDNGSDADQLLQAADFAMSQAKLQPGPCYRYYCEEMNASAMKQLSIESALRRAIRQNEFVLYYQPRVHTQTGAIIGMEALIRWQTPDEGFVMPDDFIPIAEKTGLIVPIGYWVIYQACEHLKELDQLPIPKLTLAVNLSPHQLQDEKFVETITNVIEYSGVDAKQLEFELTESAMMANIDYAEACMDQIRLMGSKFSLDDFGTGYSAFIHLQRLPITALKIDRSFINNVLEQNENAVIVNAMINLAHSLDMEVIAEGAETEHQVEFLQQHHCDQIQGYYYSAPVPYQAFRDMVIEQGNRYSDHVF